MENAWMCLRAGQCLGGRYTIAKLTCVLAVEVKRCLCSWSDTRVKNIADPVTQVRFRQLRVRVNFLSCPGLYKQLPQWR